MNKANILKASVTMTCDFMLAQPSLTSSQFHLQGLGYTCSIVFRYFPTVLQAKIVFPGQCYQKVTSLTVVRFEPRSHMS